MKKTIFITLLMVIFTACMSSDHNSTKAQQAEVLKATSSRIKLGAERLDQYLKLLEGKRVATVVNQTSTIGETHIVDTLRSLGVNIVKVFAPEHGFRGDHSAGALVNNGKDIETGLSVVSLYGKNKKPNAQMLADVDVVVFDIQDVGVRFYTYISTMHYVMEACAEEGKTVVVLDRPNPNGFYVDGPILQPEYKSFIGMHPIPTVHGLTVGELAGMINGEKWLKGEISCDVIVVPCANYTHDSMYLLPIKPSPNLPNMNAVYLYPYLGMFEGTNVSIGRGTDEPFQLVGRPGFQSEFAFKPRSMPGTSDHPKYENEICTGMRVDDIANGDLFANPRMKLEWLILFYQSNKEENGPYFKAFFYKLAGNKTLREDIEKGRSIEEIRKRWEPDLAKYREMRKKYLLYP
ncbi:DUF1343 domain-containing protein [Bacteroidia bacterium]|nr:DUF1343 domain-containing protein [Bacteroidia bacterium]